MSLPIQPVREPEHTPDQMQQAMSVIGLGAWVALATLLVVLGATLVWAFFGTMSLRLPANGVLIKSGRVITLYAPEDSQILDMSVERNHEVQKDQVVMRLDQTALVAQINALMEQGAPQEQIAPLQSELLQRSQVVSHEKGQVRDTFVHTGDYVSKGAKLMTILQSPPKGQNLECKLFVPIDKVSGIKEGMQVSVFPDFADKNVYGNMMGTVESISEYPVTLSALLDELGSTELAEAFLANGACFEVVVSLVASESTATGYRWTTSQGPSAQIGDISLLTAQIVQDEYRPIEIFLP